MDYLQYKMVLVMKKWCLYLKVLNLVINGLPSIPGYKNPYMRGFIKEVLNLVINGLPSIPNVLIKHSPFQSGFKPCYKWITFNTSRQSVMLRNS